MKRAREKRGIKRAVDFLNVTNPANSANVTNAAGATVEGAGVIDAPPPPENSSDSDAERTTQEIHSTEKTSASEIYYGIMSKSIGAVSLRQLLSLGARVLLGFLLARCTVFNDIAPFGIAYVAAAVGGTGMLLPILGALAGYLSLGFPALRYSAATFAVAVVSMFLKRRFSSHRLLIACGSAFAASLLLGILKLYDNGFDIVNLLLCITEVGFSTAGAYIFIFAQGRRFRARVSGVFGKREFCAYTLLSLALASMTPLALYGISLGRSLCVALVLLRTKQTGSVRAAALAGLITGFACDISRGFSPIHMIIFSAAGILAPLFTHYGKLLTALSFVTASAAALVWGRASGNAEFTISALYEYFVGAALFLAIPSGAYEAGSRLELLADEKILVRSEAKEEHTEKLRSLFYEKFLSAAEAYISVAEETRAKKKHFSEDRMIPILREKHCSSCEKRNSCGENRAAEREFILRKKELEERGRLSYEELSEDFAAFCPSVESFAEELNKLWFASRCQKAYEARINEGLDIISAQYGGIGDIFSRASQALLEDYSFDGVAESKISSMLGEYGINAGVLAYRDSRNRLRLEIYGSDIGGIREVISQRNYFEKEFEKISGSRVSFVTKRDEGSGLRLYFAESNDFSFELGASSRRRLGSERNGDYGGWFRREESLFILLSDGMGSGEGAKLESASVTRLLEKLLRGGIPTDEAVKTVRDTKSVENGGISYATIDLAEINLATGNATFYKFGAAPSYIKGESGIRKIGGALYGEDDRIERSRVDLHGDELIILLTDGAEDGFFDGELIKRLSASNGKDAKKLCNEILAYERIPGTQSDDASVVVVRIFKTTCKSENMVI